MPVQRVTAVNAVMEFIWTGDDYTAGTNGIQMVLYFKRNISGKIQIDLTFFMDVRLILVRYGSGVQFRIADGEIGFMNGR